MMNVRSILASVMICMLTAGGSARSNQEAGNPNHTAVAIVEVLPYVQGDPLVIETPAVDAELQREFRRSQTMLMTRPGVFDLLVRRERVRGTKWFGRMGGDIEKAAKELRQRCAVDASKDSGLLEVVVACDDPNDSLVIADELVGVYVEMREADERARLQMRIKALEGRREQILKDIRATEAEIEGVFKRWGHADLGEREYVHPVEARLMRIEEKRDDVLLQVLEQDVVVTRPDSRSRSGAVSRPGSRTLQLRLLAAEKIYRDAVKCKDELDRARMAYGRSAAVRARKERALEEVELLLDKLHMMCESPDVSRLRPVGRACFPYAEPYPAPR